MLAQVAADLARHGKVSWYQVEDRLIGIVTVYVPIIRAPSHPFWFGRQIPFVCFEGPCASKKISLLSVVSKMRHGKPRRPFDLAIGGLRQALEYACNGRNTLRENAGVRRRAFLLLVMQLDKLGAAIPIT